MAPPTVAAVYANGLAHLGYGHALWWPEGPHDSDEVRIGDVGYINYNGAFIVLFNIDERSKNDPDKDMRRWLPEEACRYFSFSQVMVKRQDRYMPPDAYRSHSVKMRIIDRWAAVSSTQCTSII